MAWAAPSNRSTGGTLTAAIWNQDVVTNTNAMFPNGYDGTTWTPTLAQSATVTKTVGQADYTKVGRWVTGQCFLTATSNGTSGNVITVTVPVAEKTLPANAILAVGSGYINIATSGQCPVIVALYASNTGKFLFLDASRTGLTNFFGTDPSVQVTSATPFKVGFTFGYWASS